jgi:hypothetical protein
MKTLSVVLLLLLAASFASAGEIFGTITDADKPIAAGVKVEIAVAGNTYAGETDKFGSYRIFAKDKGKGTLKVLYKDQTPGADIFSFDKATRYDWTVENTDGKLSLKRK